MRGYLEELLQRIHDCSWLRAQLRAVDDVELMAAVLRQPALQVVAVLARVQTPISTEVGNIYLLYLYEVPPATSST